MKYKLKIKWEGGGENYEAMDHETYKTLKNSLIVLAKNPTYQKGNKLLQLESVSIVRLDEEQRQEFTKEELVGLFS